MKKNNTGGSISQNKAVRRVPKVSGIAVRRCCSPSGIVQTFVRILVSAYCERESFENLRELSPKGRRAGSAFTVSPANPPRVGMLPERPAKLLERDGAVTLILFHDTRLAL